jgi:hypothetical protein
VITAADTAGFDPAIFQDAPRCGHVGSVKPTRPNSSRNSRRSSARRRIILGSSVLTSSEKLTGSQ